MEVERRRQPHVLDLARPDGVAVEVDAAEAADVLMSVWAICGRDEYDSLDAGRARLEEIQAAVPPDLLAEIDDLVRGEAKIPAHLLGLVWETPRPRTMHAFLETLAAADPLDVQVELLGLKHGVSPETARAAAGGDADAVAEIVAAFAEWPQACVTVEHLLGLGADVVKARLLEILPRWYDEVYVPHATDVAPALERDAAAKRELVRTLSVEEIVERATNGYRYAPGPDVRRLVLFPGYWQRPWVLLTDHDATKIFCYPLELDRSEEGPLPAELARLYKALADEGRLRLLKRVSSGPMTLSEAAQELGVAKSTAHHHLALLRHAGFLVLRDEGDDKVYSLRRDLLPQAGALLQGYLE